ncbi:MAG: LysM peptidoglycan-binding domain-containing protein [Gammaproteobacteria bacterium]
MVSIQIAARRVVNPVQGLASLIAVSVAVAAVLSGCSTMGGMFGRGDNSSTPAPVDAAARTAQPAAAPEDEPTATETAIETAAVPAEAAGARDAGTLIRPDAPKSYTVKRGDTLWDIASLFLKDPWLWPEVWIINPQVRNPHLIYPGDTLALAYGANGAPQIRLTGGGAARLNPRLRSSPLDGAIPTLPYSSISAFLAKPTVLTKDQIKQAPSVLAFREKHEIAGAGNDIYVRDLNAPMNSRYSVVHVGDAIRDPETGDLLGYEGIYTATASVTTTTNPSKAVLSDSARETLVGDKLISADTETPLNFILSSPPENLKGRIISVVDGTELIGQYQVVVINRGSRHGVVPGNVMAIDQAGDLVEDRADSGFASKMGFGKKVRLPDERSGTLLVFRTFDRVSYGLVVGASTEIHVADIVRNP